MPPYVIYARKSTESEDRQVLSIQSQIRELERIAVREGLTISEVLTESKSAKAPGRPVFGSLFARVDRGGIGGILCWKMDRLARNHLDTGRVLQSLADGKLERVITSDRTYTRDGNDRLMGTFEFATATKFIDDLRANVNRGMRARIEKGWACNLPPIGYLNDRVAKTIVKDPDRFDLVRRLWDLLLTGTTRVERIRRIAERDLGLRSRFTGRPLSKATLYAIFANSFYMGMVSLGAGGSWIGAHPPMISREEFDRARSILRRPGSARPQKREFAYTGMLRCGACGRRLTGERHEQPSGKIYIYYRCAGNHNGLCTERTIAEPSVDSQILGALGRLTMPAPILAFLRKRVVRSLEEERARRADIRRSLGSVLDRVRREEGTLLSLRLREVLDDRTFLEKRAALQQERRDIEARLDGRNGSSVQSDVLVRKILDFSAEAQATFASGTSVQRRMILESVSANTTVRGRRLALEFKIPFSQVADSGGCRSWLGLVEVLRKYLDEKREMLVIPDLSAPIATETTLSTSGPTKAA